MKMLVDTSSVLWMSLLAGKDAEHGKTVATPTIANDGSVKVRNVFVNSALFGYENAVNHLTSAMRRFDVSPSDMIFVVEGQYSKAQRKVLLSRYKETRDSRPPEAYEEFNKLKAMLTLTFQNVGAQVAIQDGVEGDDIISYLCNKIPGEKVILSNDGDLAQLVGGDVHLYRRNEVDVNPYGPFPHNLITVYKALVGDTSDNIPGALGFGEKMFLDLLVKFGDDGLRAMSMLIQQRQLDRLVEDLADMPTLKKVIDGADLVYQSWAAARLYPEWVNTANQPLRIEFGAPLGERSCNDDRLKQWVNVGSADEVRGLLEKLSAAKTRTIGSYVNDKKFGIFDVELIGTENPVFLVCCKICGTDEKRAFWLHKGEMPALLEYLQRDDVTWVGFNSSNFDAPLCSAAIGGRDVKTLKRMAQALVDDEVKTWNLPETYAYDSVDFDHIDLCEVAPGVRISLKTYAGRMGYPTMVDMPFHHDQDLTEDQLPVLEAYCFNDLGVTEWLLDRLKTEIQLRMEMSDQYGIDLRSKSDAQVAEAVLKKVVGLTSKDRAEMPMTVKYKAPAFIKTDSKVIAGLIEKLEAVDFQINRMHGGPEAPEFLKDPVKLGHGTYQCGIGGLHSTHDVKLHARSTEKFIISDFDVASYYPNLMVNAGFIPRLGGSKGAVFMNTYKELLASRMMSKRRSQEVYRELLAVEQELAEYEK